MTSEQFKTFWNSTYPDTIPFPPYFKQDFQDKWFRIHSLPESKRYAENDLEWDILLSRQNKIISDLIGNSTILFIVTGEFDFNGTFNSRDFLDHKLFTDFKFTSLEPIDMHKINPDEYDKETLYRPFIAKLNWINSKYDRLLQSIANDEIRAFFICIDKKYLIAPYDGGMDIILENPVLKDIFKIKYEDWLSSNPKGL